MMLTWALINIAVNVLLFLSIRAPLVRGYLIVNYVLMVNPAVMWLVFGLAHPKFIPGDDSYATALIFIAVFNLLLCGSFQVLTKLVPTSRLAQRRVAGHVLNRTQYTKSLLLITIVLAGFGFLAKYGLESAGALRMGAGGGGGPFLQAMKVFAGFDLIALILMGEVRLAARGRRPLFNIFLIALIATSLFFAVVSGSRAQSITVLILATIAYRDVVRRYWYVVYPSLVMAVPMIFVLFPLLGNYRNLDYDFSEARYQLEASGAETADIVSDVIVTRLNYLEPVARVIDYVDLQGVAGGSVYWNNLIGVIPRLLWPGKPQISNDSRELGHQLDLVARDDETTSIGLQVIGEAYYEYGWLGLWVAVFQALIFVLIHKNFFAPGNPAAMTVYTYASFYILQRDGYFAVVPGLIWLIIGFSIFFFAYRLLLPRAQRRPSRETLPHRFAYR